MKLRHLAWLTLLAGSVTAHAANPEAGAEIYRRHCSTCHGNDGRPVLVGAPDFTRPTALMRPDLSLLATIRAGRGGMPAFAGQLRDRDILDVVAHLRTLR